LPEITALP
jgi:hypothetical protein